jgi:DNA-directed RNA polymerase specialized sigma24 family protein
MQQPYQRDVERIFSLEARQMRAGLARRFSRTTAASIDDAVQEAFLVALTSAAVRRAWQEGGVERLKGTLRTIARRTLSREVRRSARAGALTVHVQPSHEGRLAARQLLRQTRALIPAAAQRFGGRRPQTLAKALEARMYGGLSDCAAANAAGANRAQLNRARHWVLDRVGASARN